MINQEQYIDELNRFFNIIHGVWELEHNFVWNGIHSPFEVYNFVKFKNAFGRSDLEHGSEWYFKEIISVTGNTYKFKIMDDINGNGVEGNFYIEIINGTNTNIWSENSPKFLYKKDIAGVMTIINNLLTDEEE